MSVNGVLESSDPLRRLMWKTNQKDATILLLGVRPARTISCSNLFDENDKVVPRNIDFPDGLKHYPVIVGSCNGLVSLLDENKDDIFVINPLTLQHVSFKTATLSVDFLTAYYGFGYDGCSYDYKIVRLSKGLDDGPFVDVYSMKKGSWKRLNNFPFDTSAHICYGHGIFMNGIIHWLAFMKDGRYLMATFDVATESFHDIPVPNNEIHQYCYELFGFGGCLFIISPDGFGVWIMKEYGQVNSWTECSTIRAYGQFYSDEHLCAIGEDDFLVTCDLRADLFVWKLTEGTKKTVIGNGAIGANWKGCTFVDIYMKYSTVQY